jgi:hypothetical protein
VWTQAWVGQQWTDWDASQAKPVGNQHLTLAESDAEHLNIYSALLPVLKKIPEISSIDLQ